MTLYDVVKELFAYMSIFRIRWESGSKMTPEEVEKDLLNIFHQQEIKVRQNPNLSVGYNQVRYPLVVFADDVILNSGWEYAGDWGSKLLERRFFETEVGGDRFFELFEDIDMSDPEVSSTYFMCLSLGFRGRYEPDAEELRLFKQELLKKFIDLTEEPEELICPQSYATGISKSHKLPPLLKWRHIAYLVIILLGIYLVMDRVIIWNYLTAPLKDVSTSAANVLKMGDLPSPTLLPPSHPESKHIPANEKPGEPVFKTVNKTSSKAMN